MSESTGAGFVLAPDEGRSIDLGTFGMSVKADDTQTGGKFTLLEATEPPGFGPPLHLHRDASESFYVTQGEYIVFLDQQEFRCGPGSFVFIPAGTPHGFRVGAEPSRKLLLFAPAAMVGYFDDLSEAMHAGNLGPDALAAIAAEHAMEVIGPIPESYA